MNVIIQNPFRVLGLFSNSPERTIQRQLTKINLHAGIGKIVSFDDDFPALGPINRTTDAVQEASSQLEQGKRKALYALFWFINSSPVDEIALGHLRLGDTLKAHQVWEQAIKDKPINARNFSSATNYSTLTLWYAVNAQKFNFNWFRSAMTWKCFIIDSGEFDQFIAQVAGENSIVDKNVLRKEFIQEVVKLVSPYQSKGQLTRLDLFRSFEPFPIEAKQTLIETLTAQPQTVIEKSIKQAKANRAETPGDGEVYGEELYNNTIEDLQFLKEIWGTQNLQYQLLVNKVAEEIRMCVHDFFTEYRDSESYDPCEAALSVISLAQQIGPTGQYESRIDEMAEFIQDWIDDRPERDKAKKLREPINFITEKIENFQNARDSIETAKALITSCKPKLNTLKSILGASDDLYLKISSAIAGNAMGMLVSFINEEQESFQSNISRLRNFPRHTASALEVQKLLMSLDLTKDVRARAQENLSVLKSIHSPFVKLARNQLNEAEAKMAQIMEWQFGRTSDTKAYQINQQNAVIAQLKQDLQILQAPLL